MNALTPLPRRSIVDEAHDALRARILRGHWLPGERVPTEAELTRQLGVSRGTVREALNRLASAGLVAIPHGGSKRVRDFRDHAGLEILAELVVSAGGAVDLDVVRSVAEMRAAIAPDVARLAALRRSDAAAQELLALATALDPDWDLNTQLEHELRWWTALVLASGNLAYRLAYNTLRATYTDSRPALLGVIEAEIRAHDRYTAVSSAVLDRAPEAAQSHARELVELGNVALFRALNALSPGV